MAVRFDAAADRLLRTANLPSYDANYSHIFWFYITAMPGIGAYANIFAISDDSNDADYIAVVGIGSSQGNLVNGVLHNGSYNEAQGATALAASTWYCCALIRSATNSRVLYLGTLTTELAAQATNTNNPISPVRTAPSRMEFGAIMSSNTDPFSGRVSNIRIWTAARTLGELQNEQFSAEVQNLANLHIDSPTFPGATERLADWSGNGYNWTASGTLTDEQEPPLVFDVPMVFVVPAAGGTTHSAAASLSGAATQAVAGQRIRQGAIVLSGVATQAVIGQRVVSGAGGFAGVGTQTVAGQRVAQVAVALAGTATQAVAGQRIAQGASALAGVANQTVAAQHIAQASASLSGAGALQIVGTVAGVQLGASILTGQATQTVAGQRIASGATALNGIAAQTVAGQRIVSGASTLSGIAACAQIAQVIRQGASALVGTATQIVIGTIAGIQSGAAVLIGIAAQTAIGQRIVSASGGLSASGTLTTAAQRIAQGASALAGAATQGVIGQVIHQAQTALNAIGTQSATARATYAGRAVLLGNGLLGVVGGIAGEIVYDVIELSMTLNRLLSGGVTMRRTLAGEVELRRQMEYEVEL